MGALARVPLWVMLPCLAVSLVAAGAVAVGLADVSAARAGFLQQVDDDLLACAGSVEDRSVVTPGSGPACGQAASGRYDMELLTPAGQLLFPEGPAPADSGSAGTSPALPASPGWLAAHRSRPVTVPGGWRVLVQVVHYQAQRILFVYSTQDVRFVIGGRSGPGPSGLLVVASGLAGLRRITAQVAAGFAAGACAVLVLLAGAGLAMIRAVLRPVRLAAARLEEFVSASGDL
jgi:hypothetical protein